MDGGGSIALISTRATRIPHGPVASSSTPRSCVLIAVAARQRLLEVERADDVAQGGDRQLLDRLDVVLDFVGGRAWIGDLEIDDGVDRHSQVVARDHRLRWETHDLLAQVDQRAHAVDERQQDGDTRSLGAHVTPSRSTTPARAWGTIRTVRTSKINKTATTTIAAINRSHVVSSRRMDGLIVMVPCHDDCGRAGDLHDPYHAPRGHGLRCVVRAEPSTVDH